MQELCRTDVREASDTRRVELEELSWHSSYIA